MISLKIQNLVLVEKAEIHFGEKLNIITGETGAGKSAILSAIRLISGGRADASLIREGADFAIIEAMLHGPVFLRREIHRSGKNRCFIDDAQVSLKELQAASRIEIVDQNSTLENEADLLDSFAGTKKLVDECREIKQQNQLLSQEIAAMSLTPKERQLEWARKDLEWIEEVNLKEGEEEQLTQEYHLLTHSQGLSDKISELSTLLESILPESKRAHHLLEGCVRVDPSLTESAEMVKTAHLALQEAAHNAARYHVNADPRRLSFVEERLDAINKLQKRFPDPKAKREALQKEIDGLINLDADIEEKKQLLARQEQLLREKLSVLKKERHKASLPLATQVLKEIRELNLPHAEFMIQVDEDVEFLFSANLGGILKPLTDVASGGERQRVLFALKIILSSKETLIFDEIDSNVGGQTAAILGEKLKKISDKSQVICVTHFVQVAKCADAHYLVTKNQEKARAFSLIQKLGDKEKEIEYGRMLGNVR